MIGSLPTTSNLIKYQQQQQHSTLPSSSTSIPILSSWTKKEHQKKGDQHHDHHPFQTRRKSINPHRSPTLAADDQSVVFQLDLESHAFSPPPTNDTILSTLRKRVLLERKQLLHPKRPRLYKPQQRLVTRIKIPTKKVPPPSPRLLQQQQKQQTTVSSLTPLVPNPTITVVPSSSLSQQVRPKQVISSSSSSVSSSSLKSQQQQHGTGRPARIKGPCQACHESSDGCMRKAFNWPFPSNAVFNDKGRPYVYLCNKCGLRYNKSGGCVCRNCRWVLCKEEKRKAMQHITYMRRTRADGRVDPDDDIVDFVCSPKYWSCGRPWKVGWIPQGELDENDDGSIEDEDEQQQQQNQRTLFVSV
ncbi:hypothetical protein BDA99DRAFT_537838 [Phascolomyces articulosus]|uniref:Uncharacterized protein n=1 Tax=Phascolomyces articulosus TaxID=60185 RepID=A0AAD5JYT9_9FUNG|nr:hypothetical protein BDA99DRAFT_537838 [Phascolomyces articulosus]